MVWYGNLLQGNETLKCNLPPNRERMSALDSASMVIHSDLCCEFQLPHRSAELQLRIPAVSWQKRNTNGKVSNYKRLFRPIERNGEVWGEIFAATTRKSRWHLWIDDKTHISIAISFSLSSPNSPKSPPTDDIVAIPSHPIPFHRWIWIRSPLTNTILFHLVTFSWIIN